MKQLQLNSELSQSSGEFNPTQSRQHRANRTTTTNEDRFFSPNRQKAPDYTLGTTPALGFITMGF